MLSDFEVEIFKIAVAACSFYNPVDGGIEYFEFGRGNPTFNPGQDSIFITIYTFGKPDEWLQPTGGMIQIFGV